MVGRALHHRIKNPADRGAVGRHVSDGRGTHGIGQPFGRLFAGVERQDIDQHFLVALTPELPDDAAVGTDHRAGSQTMITSLLLQMARAGEEIIARANAKQRQLLGESRDDEPGSYVVKEFLTEKAAFFETEEKPLPESLRPMPMCKQRGLIHPNPTSSLIAR